MRSKNKKNNTSYRAVSNFLIHKHNMDKDIDPLKLKVLKLAYIGKAAYNIGGLTIHSTLSLPINKKKIHNFQMNV